MRTLPLRRFSARDLRTLLDEEAALWAGELLWDYSEVSSAVASGIDRRSLTGRVLEDGDAPVAYCYYIQEAGRAVVGSLFAAAPWRDRGHEEGLLDGVLGEALAETGNVRVECQTLFSTAPGADSRFGAAGFTSRERRYLVRDLLRPASVPEHRLRLRPLRRDDLAMASEIIFKSHQGSLDAALNMTYGTLAHCRAFVETLVMRSGCGKFDSLASFVAEIEGEVAGVVLGSHLSRGNGHICQVSVLPEAQGRGVGAVLVTSALLAFRSQGLRTASLSVTVHNERAYRLYERLGFSPRKRFAAHAWARPPRRIDLPA